MTEKVAYIDAHRAEFGVEPICRALEDTPAQIAPSSYYAAKSRPLCARAVRDEELCAAITRIHEANYGVYGVRKIHAELRREGRRVAESTVRRLMRQLGLRGISRAKGPKTTKPAPETDRPTDLVQRQFVASHPNELWVADLTYVRTFSGWVYVAFVLDVYSRMIVGWQVSTRLYTDLALDALSMGIWRREHAGQDLTGLTHHSDRGVQYRAIRYAERLDECDAVASVGSKGDSYDCHGRGAELALQSRTDSQPRPLDINQRRRDRDRRMGGLVQRTPPPRRTRPRPTGRARSRLLGGESPTRSTRNPIKEPSTKLDT